jgi:ribosomal protein S18 acetylase RimI-like enzyme
MNSIMHAQERDATSDTALTIRDYRESDEQGWLRCSVLSFLDTAYFDSVYRHKPRYGHPAAELVAETDGAIVGVIDVEYEETPGTVCTVCTQDSPDILGAMIWHLAVHPDHQGRGIGSALLQEAQQRAGARGIGCFEVWTRDDPATLRWYDSRGFVWVKSYLHVYLQGKDEIGRALSSTFPNLRPVSVFAHYTGPDGETVRSQFERVHECNCFRLSFGGRGFPSGDRP